jgi:hypothetical protein
MGISKLCSGFEDYCTPDINQFDKRFLGRPKIKLQLLYLCHSAPRRRVATPDSNVSLGLRKVAGPAGQAGLRRFRRPARAA